MADTIALDTEPYNPSPNELDLENPINWQSPLNRGLNAWYRSVPELSSSTVAFDLTNLNRTNVRHGTLKGGTLISPIAAPGTAQTWRFDGTDDYIDCGTFSPAGITMCASAYFYTFAAGGGFSGVVCRGLVGGETCQLMVNTSGKLTVSFGATGGTAIYNGTGSNTLLANNWYRLAASYDAIGQTRGYVNARIDNTASASGILNTSTAVFTIGSDLSSAGRLIKGLINDVRIYNRALTQMEIKLECEAAFQGFPNELNYLPYPVVSIEQAAAATTNQFLCLLGVGT